MADIVLHGLGDGPYVTNGLGHVTPPAPGVMAAYVACGASVTATLTADGGTGSTVDMALVGVFSDLSTRNLKYWATWTSSNPAVATVDNSQTYNRGKVKELAQLAKTVLQQAGVIQPGVDVKATVDTLIDDQVPLPTN